MADLPLHHVHQDTGIAQFDVFIAGSGPLGALFARQLVDNGHNVVMVEIGDQDTRVPGAHKKNEIEYQKDIDRFVRVIQGALSTVSVPVSSAVIPTLDPSAWRIKDPNKHIISNGRNPYQRTYNNLGAQAVTRGVGGMSTHWTCATPEFLKRDTQGNVFERPVIYEAVADDDAEWQLLYNAARSIIGTSTTEYNHSIRHNTVLKTLQESYPDRNVQSLPLACHRLAEDSPYVQWHAADNIFGDMFDPAKKRKRNAKDVERGTFVLLTNTRCTKLHLTPDTSPDEAQLIPNLGRYITEQPMAFCQIILRQAEPTSKALVDDVTNFDDKPDWWEQAVVAYQEENPKDPLPIPLQDGEPQVTIPASYERPWHTQIHRDAFSYGETGPLVDSRVVVDLRFFGRQTGIQDNRIIFENDIKDGYGMPQPTFVYEPTTEFANESSEMMDEPGLALHLGGSTRLGRGNVENEYNASVADYNSQVWKFDNLYVGGNGLIPTAFGANPTLTSMCLAIRAAYKIHQDLSAQQLTAPDPAAPLEKTPEDWVMWTNDATDPNLPDHKHLRAPHRRV
ncbi:hypothetical protein C0995_008605 [Termitomyces sp. Mi166|nr:hypothetical protein C0995_008605 [Termitomyces sp. Mi166\